MNIEIDKRWTKKLKGRFERYEFEVGILEDKPHRTPMRGARGQKGQDVLTSYAGGPVRKARGNSGMTIQDVSRENSKRLGFNYLQRPFKKPNDSDILKFANEFVKLALGRSKDKRVTNLMQAIVRNPILRGEYGAPNSALTQKIKGFNRPMIDTAQLFKNIKARVKRRSGWSRV